MSVTLLQCFLLLACAAHLALPRWACVFNTLPVFLLLSPFRIVGTGNIANAVMFAGLFFLI